MSTPAPRRSTRASNAATKRYTNDAFKASGLNLSASSSGSSADESSEEEPSFGKRRGDEAFTVGPADEEDDIGSVSDADALEEVDNSNSDPDASISDVLSDSDAGSRSAPTSRRADNSALRSRAKDHQHSARTAYRDAYHGDIIGNHPGDIAAYKATKLKFWDDVTVPHRSYEQDPRAGLAYPRVLSVDERKQHLQQQRRWYVGKNARQILRSSQDISEISENEATNYTNQVNSSRNIVLGPYPQQRDVTLPALDSINIDSAFPPLRDTKGDSDTAGRGWLLNLGHNVHTLSWVPGHEGAAQYLSASTWIEDATPSKKENVSAFGPWPPAYSALQVWSISASGGQKRPANLDQSYKPKLLAFLCFDWGMIKCFEWCPLLSANGSVDQPSPCLGLLAIVHGDGKVRVLDVSLPTSKTQPQYQKVHSVCFEAIPQDTVFTCLAWLSSTVLAAGCANGYVAVWDIEQHILEKDKSSEARPILYEPLHDSYVTQIQSCGPYLPHLLLTAGQDGYVQLCDIYDPLADVVYAARHRLGLSIIAWHPHLNHALVGDDVVMGVSIRKFSTSATTVVHIPAPATSIATSHTHSSTLVGCYDGSVVICNPMRKCTSTRQRVDSYFQYWVKHDWRNLRADESAGPKRRKVEPNSKPKGKAAADAETQVSVTAEPGAEDESGYLTHESQVSGSTTQLHDNTSQGQDNPVSGQVNNQRDLKVNPANVETGLTRLTLGFSVRHVKTMNPATTTSDASSKRKIKVPEDSGSARKDTINNPATIFDEQTGVTALAWNPNIVCGGWASVGWGDGLVMVSDLCWD